jgi:hypothetical protein
MLLTLHFGFELRALADGAFPGVVAGRSIGSHSFSFQLDMEKSLAPQKFRAF